MKLKISGTVKVKKNLAKILPDARSKFAKEMKRTIVDIIVEKITSGLSPVKGQNRYPKYSSKYAKFKGRQAPVDLVKTGDMLNNLRAKIKANKSIEIYFPNALQSKKAARHNFGLKGMPKRKILPTGKEIFKSEIMKKIVNIANKAVQKSIK